ncbi:MAG: ABC transporter permease [Acidimicrobiales bacterium]|nr:ABC transporter permease [Acidimicrobiales bacterium]
MTDTAVPVQPATKPSLVAGFLALVGGVALVVVALEVDTSMLARIVAGLAGGGLAYRGLDRLVARLVGRPVETDLWLAAVWVGLVVGAAIFADLLPLSEASDTSKTLTEPSRATPDLWSSHPFGTDTQALDVLGGVIYGARVSLQVSFFAVAIGTVVGGLIGISAGYFGGRLDSIIGVLTDSMLAFPPLILLLAVVTAVEPNVVSIGLALALLGVPTYTRLARANTISLVHREFVLAARTLGAGHGRIILRELVPNVIRPLLSYSFIIVAVLIVAEASLSFLGVGISRPTPTWGNMISAGQGEIRTSPHLVFIPSLVMFLTVFALNRIGDAARRRWDPRESAI